MPDSLHDPVPLGLLPPLTGLVALYGPEISWAARIACDEVNAAGGVLGRPLSLVIEDDGSLPETAVPAAQRLLDQHGCVALVGNLLSSSRIAVASQVAEPRRVPYLNFSFYEGSIANRYFFNFAALPNQQIDHMIPYLAELAGPKMFFAGSNYEWPRGSIDAAKRALLRIGGEVVGEEYLPIGSDQIDDLLSRVRMSGANVFVPYFAGEDQINLLSRFTELGLKRQMAVVMGHYDEAMAACLAPEVREGLYSSNTYFMSVDTPANRRYLEALAELPEVEGLHPEGNGVLTNFGEGAYLCVHAFAQAVSQAQSLEVEALIPALERVEINGPQGRVRMDPATHHAHVHNHLAQCGFDGTFAIVESFGSYPPHIPRRYRRGESASASLEEARAMPGGADASGRLNVAVVAVDGAGRIEYVNRALRRLWGLDLSASLAGAPVGRLWDPSEDLSRIEAELARRPEWHGTLTARYGDGRRHRLMVVAEPTFQADDTGGGYTLACLDPQEIPAQQRIGTHQILAMVDVAVLAMHADGVITEANRRAAEMFGYGDEELIGLPLSELVPPEYRQRHIDHVRAFFDGEQSERLMGARPELSAYRKDGSPFPVEISISKLDVGGDWAVVATVRDITDRKASEEALVWRASHDALTGLANRSLILERLAQALRRSGQRAHGVALLFIDLDGFKLINDTHGHSKGDELLKAIAQRLVEHVRPGDTVARLGGDEFVILCDQVESPASIASLADRLNDLLRKPVELDGDRLFAAASIGVATGHGSTHGAEDLLRNADAAMYEAKERGRDGWRFFSEEIHEQARKRLDITNGLRQAIERDELQVRFQPILCAKTRLIRGAELLLRWVTPDGEIPPSYFVPIAELSGSIVPIGKWVFREACRAEVGWRARFGEQAPYVSVNVSARQLNDESLVESFCAIIEETGARPERILLELTETSLMSDVHSNLSTLRELAELGMLVAVDDFGTGYSSLAQLLRLPVRTLKIDREFVDGLDKRSDSRAIVSAVCSLARSLALKVIGEGVENARQLDYLRDLGCDAVQGYYFYRPMTPEAFLDALIDEDDGTRPSMPEDLHAVLYVSRAVRPLSASELRALLDASRSANCAQGITGYLLYCDGVFMQMIEGSRPRVERLMDRIRRDARHEEVRVIYEGAISRRTFYDWCMGFHDLMHLDLDVLPGASCACGTSLMDLAHNPRLCLGLITAFAGR
ncbi:ABC transporter substrate-binding protein [Thiorhodococcus minor]|uniref:ABC transporter substrate-binding protein n=1 Tax=Thiorhodococcus minor TaxID=57489 RepID=A0A6M0K8Y1_9GAMM|nr:ABC transporter substrate-binding protein [Thiorhodococcus minor]NEV64895.1 ABC transporter substrate-binding protein [Thiorhodococcus minor]